MKNRVSSQNGQVQSARPKQRKQVDASGTPRLRIHAQGHKSVSIDIATASANDWSAIRERCKASDAPVVEVIRLQRWPDEARFSMFKLVHELGDRCRLKILGKEYDDPFEGVLAVLKKPCESTEAHRGLYHAAIEAAAIFCGDLPEAAAKRINQSLKQAGEAGINHLRLVKQIREIAGPTRPQALAIDAQTAARMFLDHLAENQGIQEGQAFLRYYQGDFYQWRGQAWKCLETAFDSKVMRFLQSQEIPRLTERFAKDVVAHLRAMTLLDCQEPMPFFVVQEEPLMIERRPWLVCRNGAIDLEKAIAEGVPEPFPVDSRFFNQVVLPFPFTRKAKCPLWKETLTDILPKAEEGDHRQKVLQEAFGYTLLPDCRFQKMFVLCGPGGNGKSTITEIWQAMLGQENYSNLALEALGDEYRAWELKEKRANFSGELNYLGRINEGLIKRLVSGEEISANRKFKEPVRFRPSAKLIVNTNSLPQIQDPTEGSWDRLVVLPFEVRIRGTKKEDRSRVNKLKDELPGILLWAITGLRRLLKQNRFTPCNKCAQSLDEHRRDSDSVRHFAAECCVKRSGYETLSEPLYQTYRQYAESTGRKPCSIAEFGRRMKYLGWEKRRGSRVPRRPIYSAMALTEVGRGHVQQWAAKNQQSSAISYPAERKMEKKPEAKEQSLDLPGVSGGSQGDPGSQTPDETSSCE